MIRAMILGGGLFSLAAAACAQTVAAWGVDSSGSTIVPVGLNGVVAVSAGNAHSLALKADGTVSVWGSNEFGQTAVPAGLTNIIAVEAGSNHSLALKTDGTVVGWGENTNGEATPPAGLANVVAVAAGQGFSAVLKSDGSVTAWGLNSLGQTVIPAVWASALDLGYSHGMALRLDASVHGWGSNFYGQAVMPAGLGALLTVSAGAGHTLGLRENGTIATWGWGALGLNEIPASLTGTISLAASGSYSLAVTDAKRVVGWGFDDSYRATGGTGMENVLQVSAWNAHSLALIDDPAAVPKIISPLRAVTAARQAMVSTRPFSYKIRASGAPSSVGAANLPLGLSFDPVSGVISGLVENPGTHDILLTASNGLGSVSKTLRLHVLGTPQIAPVPSSEISPVWQRIPLFLGGTTRTTSGLPAGVTLDPPSGDLVGTPVPGSQTLTLGNSNAHGSMNRTLSWVVRPGVKWGTHFLTDKPIPNGLLDVVKFAAGESHSVALRANGQVVVWGDNRYNQSNPYVPSSLSGVVDISAGLDHTLALLENGHVVAWGDNYAGKLNVPSDLTDVVAISAGRQHSLALKADGTVVGWGWPGIGIAPVGLDKVSKITAIAGGYDFSLALRADGTVAAWGMRTGSTGAGPVNQAIAGIRNVVAISAGLDGGYLLLQADGTVIGSNVPDGLKAVAIAGGGTNNLALKADGSVVQWESQTQFDGMRLPAGLQNVVGIAAGYRHGLGVVASPAVPPRITSPLRARGQADTMFINGNYFHYQIQSAGVPTGYSAVGLPAGLVLNPATGLISGNPTQAGDFSTSISAINNLGTSTKVLRIVISPPFAPADLAVWGASTNVNPAIPAAAANLVSISAGWDQRLVATADGAVLGWGNTTVPPGLTDVISVASGALNSIALRADGTVVGWGPSYRPAYSTAPEGLAGVTAISAGDGYFLALVQDGTVVQWGDSSIANPPRRLDQVVDIAAGVGAAMALRADGTVASWGTWRGQSPNNLADVVDIASSASSTHWLALKADGTVVAGGSNFYGEAVVPTGLANVIAIAAGGGHSLALRQDGSIVAWGKSNSGQAAPPIGMRKAVAIAAGNEVSMAIMANPDAAPRILGPRRANVMLRNALPQPSPFRYRAVVAGIPSLFQATGLPAGLTPSLPSLLDGEPTAPGLFSVSLTAGNAQGTSTKNLQLSVLGLPVINSLLPPELRPVTQTIQAFISEGTFTVSGLPGMTLNHATGELTGTPVPGVHTATLTSTNAVGTVSRQWTTRTQEVVTWGSNFDRPVPNGLANARGTGFGTYPMLLRDDRQVIFWDEYRRISPVPALTAMRAFDAYGDSFIGRSVTGQALPAGNAVFHTPPTNLSGAVSVAAGLMHLLVAREDGTVLAWGSDGGTAVPSGLNDVVSVSAGYDFSLALKRNGTVVGWGQPFDNYGQATPPAGLTNVVKVVAGWNYAQALRGDGTVVAWGGVNPNQLPGGLSNIVGISRGCGVKADGTVVVWGATPPPVGLKNVIFIASDHTSPARVVAIMDANPPAPMPSHIYALAGRNYSQTFAAPFLEVPLTATGLPPGVILTNDANRRASLCGTPQSAGVYQVILDTVPSSTYRQTITFRVDPAPASPAAIATAFDVWKFQYGQPGAEAAAARDADPDGDGLANLLEWLLSSNPTAASPATPWFSVQNGQLILEMDVNPAVLSLLAVRGQFASDPGFQKDVRLSQPEQIPGAPDGKQRLRFTDGMTPGTPRRFGALRAED